MDRVSITRLRFLRLVNIRREQTRPELSDLLADCVREHEAKFQRGDCTLITLDDYPSVIVANDMLNSRSVFFVRLLLLPCVSFSSAPLG